MFFISLIVESDDSMTIFKINKCKTFISHTLTHIDAIPIVHMCYSNQKETKKIISKINFYWIWTITSHFIRTKLKKKKNRSLRDCFLPFVSKWHSKSWTNFHRNRTVKILFTLFKPFFFCRDVDNKANVFLMIFFCVSVYSWV